MILIAPHSAARCRNFHPTVNTGSTRFGSLDIHNIHAELIYGDPTGFVPDRSAIGRRKATSPQSHLWWYRSRVSTTRPAWPGSQYSKLHRALTLAPVRLTHTKIRYPVEMGMILCRWTREPWCRSPWKLSRSMDRPCLASVNGSSPEWCSVPPEPTVARPEGLATYEPEAPKPVRWVNRSSSPDWLPNRSKPVRHENYRPSRFSTVSTGPLEPTILPRTFTCVNRRNPLPRKGSQLLRIVRNKTFPQVSYHIIHFSTTPSLCSFPDIPQTYPHLFFFPPTVEKYDPGETR